MTDSEYLDAVRKLKKKHDLELRKFAYDFAMGKVTKELGDKISDISGDTLIIDRIRASTPFGSRLPEPCYEGYLLTKAGKPRKDKQRHFIYQYQL